ncbi:hypothetical protein BaRGS_00005929 [Batillaria attramentaria]|uniref:Uncharacterized protein n=1 Tax=Batillaria attramentaria TaxID=370345 RepID=A0ABD0LSZ2_9CAEN
MYSQVVECCIFVVLIIVVPVARQSRGNDCSARGNGVVYTYGRDTVSILTADLIDALDWKAVTVVYLYQNNSGVLELDLLINRLHVRRIQTMVLEDKQEVYETFLSKSVEAGRFLVLGQFVAVKEVFQEVARLADKTDWVSKLFHTEWVTVVAQEDVSELEHSVRSFENVAIVAKARGQLSLWTMRRDGDVTRAIFVTSLPDHLPPCTRRQVLANPSRGLGGRTLKIAVREAGNFLFSVAKNGRKVYQGVLMDLLHELCLCLNFTYVIMKAPDANYGQQLEDGRWNGLIGMLTRKEVDLAVAAFRLTNQRAAVVDPSSAYFYDDARIIFRKPQRDAARDAWSFFFRPFQTDVFVAVGASFLAVLVLLMLCEACRYWWNGGRLRGAAFGRDFGMLLMVDGVEVLLAGLVNRPTRETPSRAGRVLVCAWLLLGVVLASVYSSKLTATLAVTDQALPFSSMAELASEVEVYKQFYKGVLKFAASDPSVRSPLSSVHKEKVFAGRYAVVLGSSELYHAWREENCEIAMTTGVGMKKTGVFYLQKGSPYTSIISSEIERMVAAGLVSHWTERWSQKNAGRCGDGGEKGQIHREIQLVEVLTAFYLAGAGVGLAVLTLGLECLSRRVTCLVRISRQRTM